MAVSSFVRLWKFKSRIRIVAAFLLRSRDRLAKRADTLKEEIRRLKEEDKQLRQTIRKKDKLIKAQSRRNARLRAEIKELREQPLRFPDDPPLPNHHYGATMIALCLRLVLKVGLRATPEVLKVVFETLNISVNQVPDYTTVRIWTLRAGVAAIERPIEPADDWIWMADHSNQIGQEKVLSIIGIRACDLPPPGEPLRRENMRVLEVVVDTDWKREDMTEVYQLLSEQCGGPPLALIVDGAVELREGAEPLQNQRETMLILRDFKHYAANILKKVVGDDERFEEFSKQIGRTRSSIQQTELAHFTPPSPKSKARFMNLRSTLLWAVMVLWHLSNHRSKSRQGISAARMNDKLGWMREYRDDILRWNACQDVVSAALKFINEQGVFKGAARWLSASVRVWQRDVNKKDKVNAPSRLVLARLVKFVRDTEKQIPEGMRLPMSTEILESSFGQFKRLERQHSKGGFTGLVAAYGILFDPITPESIRRDFAQVKTKDMRAWVAKTLGSTLAAKRQTAYREQRNDNELIQRKTAV